MNLLFLATTIGLALGLTVRFYARRPQVVRVRVPVRRVTPRRPELFR
jgi:hypothetical protein